MEVVANLNLDRVSRGDHDRLFVAGTHLSVGVEDHVDYHRPTDPADRISPALLSAAGERILDLTLALDEALPHLPPR